MMKRILEGCILKEMRRLPSCRNRLCAQYRHSPFSISPSLKSVLKRADRPRHSLGLSGAGWMRRQLAKYSIICILRNS